MKNANTVDSIALSPNSQTNNRIFFAPYRTPGLQSFYLREKKGRYNLRIQAHLLISHIYYIRGIFEKRFKPLSKKGDPDERRFGKETMVNNKP